MVSKPVYLGASLTAVISTLAGILGGSGALAPWGIVGGLVAGWTAETVSDGLYDGALAGLFGAVATVILMGVFSAVSAALTAANVGIAGFVGAYTSTVIAVMIVPTFAVEGIIIGPLTRYAKTTLQRRPPNGSGKVEET
ncbi:MULTISPECIES: DUF5518 domain-containing protein [unclassified Haladaptatus]|uniref:DUF5518 domain-containing protein n=1 Tax=unclassified Haladaptatus TaxID=2622732 RepID=UPI00209C4A2C|nr:MULTISPECIES: DUF5518 domain-containing protein [unclassified Haladaptatus]MCO8243512.1 DUF5518 domain-containing protein [Haladaptatus sp. AB643]MCO8254921.1 DUF5518 domain-containing protein [Haladaptatus sp. AB618]